MIVSLHSFLPYLLLLVISISTFTKTNDPEEAAFKIESRLPLTSFFGHCLLYCLCVQLSTSDGSEAVEDVVPYNAAARRMVEWAIRPTPSISPPESLSTS